MAQPATSPWVDRKLVARMVELWPDHSASQICGVIWREFKVALTRNAVVGRLHRDKITCEHKINVHPLTTRQHSAKMPRTAHLGRSRITREPSEMTALRCAEIVPLNISLNDLEPWHCRYPYGNGPFTYCGHVKLDDVSYCGPHFNLCTGPGTYGERKADVGVQV